MFSRHALASLLILPVLVSCSDSAGPAQHPTAARVKITPDSATLSVSGDTVQFKAQVEDTQGNELSSAHVSWSVSPAGVAVVDSSGRVVGRCAGEASVVATSGSVSAAVQVRIPQQIAFLNTRDDPSSAAVVLVDDNGERRRVLTSSASWPRWHSPTWLPDGRRIVVSTGSLNLATTTLSAVGMEGTSTLLFAREGNVTTLAWSPLGDALAFEAQLFAQQNPRSLFLWDPLSQHVTRLTLDDAMWDEAPAWSPDGRKIVFQRRAASGTDWGLYTIDRTGANLLPLLTGLAGSAQPDWSPDGNTVVFVAGYTGLGTPTALYIIRPDGSGLQRLAAGDGGVNPVWSPDGKRIAFTRESDASLTVMNADGTSARAIASGASQPAWRPRCVGP
jgi:TolB protein